MSSDLGPYDGHLNEKGTVSQLSKNATMPKHYTVSNRLTNSPISWRMALHSSKAV